MDNRTLDAAGSSPSFLVPDPAIAEAGEALAAAQARGDLAGMAEVIDQHGVEIAHSAYASTQFDIASELPLDLADDRPGLAFRFEDIGRMPIGTTKLGLPATPADARAEFARTGDLRLRQALLPLATRRRLAMFAEALEVVEAAVPLAEACVYPWYGDRSQILPYWYLQAGITAQLAGDFDSARHLFTNAWRHHRRDPFGFVARATAGKLAQHEAICGDHAASSLWLERAQAAPQRADLWVDQFADSNVSAAEAIRAIDGLAADAEDRLRRTLPPTQRTEQWAIFLWLFVQQALTRRDTARAQGYIDTALAARAPEMTGRGMSRALVELARAEVLLARGQGAEALESLHSAPDLLGMTRTLTARALLLTGQIQAAVTQAGEVLDDGTTSARARAEALLVAAAGRIVIGDRRGAIEAARQATNRIQEQGSPRLLATVPRAALADLEPQVPALTSLFAELDAREVTDLYPALVNPITITARERDLLRALSSGRTLQHISRVHHVSVNTTKTHLANLRRKLGAKNRDEVLHRAEQLGLLEP